MTDAMISTYITSLNTLATLLPSFSRPRGSDPVEGRPFPQVEGTRVYVVHVVLLLLYIADIADIVLGRNVLLNQYMRHVLMSYSPIPYAVVHVIIIFVTITSMNANSRHSLYILNERTVVNMFRNICCFDVLCPAVVVKQLIMQSTARTEDRANKAGFSLANAILENAKSRIEGMKKHKATLSNGTALKEAAHLYRIYINDSLCMDCFPIPKCNTEGNIPIQTKIAQTIPLLI